MNEAGASGGKLVSDRIPDLIRRNGGQPRTRRLSDDEFATALTRKLIEEAEEVAANPSAEELADVIDVVGVLAQTLGMSMDDIEAVRRAKVAERGGFDERLHLASVRDAQPVEDAQSPFPAGSVILVSGIMGAGKSTVAKLLAERFPRAAHVRGDAFRRMIVSGRSDMVPTADADALAQLQLRYCLAAMVADGYAEAGFTAVYQDIVLGEDLVQAPDRIRARPLFVVVLAPSPDAVLRRAEGRAKSSGYGEWTVEELDAMLRRTPRIGLWIDSSEQTAQDTVEEIWHEAAAARVELRRRL